MAQPLRAEPIQPAENVLQAKATHKADETEKTQRNRARVQSVCACVCVCVRTLCSQGWVEIGRHS